MRRGIVGTGLGFTVLFVSGRLLLAELFGGFADSDAFFIGYYSGHAHHLRDLVGGHLFVASALVLLLFVKHLTRHLQFLGGSEVALRAAHSSGVVGVAVLTVTMSEVIGRLTGDEP